MKEPKIIQIVGLVIAIPLAIFAVYNNLWAEPEPPKIIPTVVIETDPAYTELIQEFNIQTLEGEEMTREGELDLLAACVEAEAGNQSLLGKRLVVDVILNRVEDPDFPNNIAEVIGQPGQFDVVDNGAIKTAMPTESTWMAIYTEMIGLKIDQEIIFFKRGGYSNFGTPWERVGDHYFSTK